MPIQVIHDEAAGFWTGKPWLVITEEGETALASFGTDAEALEFIEGEQPMTIAEIDARFTERRRNYPKSFWSFDVDYSNYSEENKKLRFTINYWTDLNTSVTSATRNTLDGAFADVWSRVEPPTIDAAEVDAALAGV